MQSQQEALSLIVRALARASAVRDEAFTAELGTQLRTVLCSTTLTEPVFDEVFAWLATFETASVHPAPDPELHPPT